MPGQNQPTRTMAISEGKNALTELVHEVSKGKTRILLDKDGSPVAALVSVGDLARLELFDREWEEGTKAIQRFSQAFADVTPDEAEAEVARIIAEVRRRRRAAREAERRAA